MTVKLLRRRKFCECGCGQVVTYYNGKWRRFVSGHNQRGKKPWNKGLTVESDERMKLISRKLIGRMTWNKGLTKEIDERIMAYSRKLAGRQGHPCWNKGFTKETHPSLAIGGRKGSEKLKGRRPTLAQLSHLREGWGWNKGLTKETCSSIARASLIISEKLKGRKNPEHSIRMKKYHEDHPEKHPNSILAKKQRRKGYTRIEKIIDSLLKRIGIKAIFNYKVGTKWVDFGIVDKKRAIECDGSFWHQDKEKEEERDLYLRDRGWEVLHLEEEEIEYQISLCRKKIEEFVFCYG